MRRAEREITDKAEVIKIIEKCDMCCLALSGNNVPYIVPMNYGFAYENDRLTLYFHGAKEGKKLDIIKENPVGCFEMDCSHRLVEGEQACQYTMEYESVIGNGNITICEERDEKKKALIQLMKKYAKDKEFAYPDAMIDAVMIFKLEATDFTGKRSLKK